jgi:hypothetical protein
MATSASAAAVGRLFHFNAATCPVLGASITDPSGTVRCPGKGGCCRFPSFIYLINSGDLNIQIASKFLEYSPMPASGSPHCFQATNFLFRSTEYPQVSPGSPNAVPSDILSLIK